MRNRRLCRDFAHRGLQALILVVAPGLVFAVPADLSGQEEVDTLMGWSGEAEVSASLFFGNTEQTVVTTRTSATHTDSTAELGGTARFGYGEATDPDGVAFVTRRSWEAGGTGEYRPFNAVSPFAEANVESSLEKRIDARYSLGLGAKVDLVSTATTRIDWSGAVLGERTRFEEEGEVEIDEELMRWSTQLQLRRSFDDEAVVLDSETTYRPVLDDFGRYTLTSTSSLSYALADYLSLRISFVDRYDSGAEDRGAESNNDGELFVGLLSAF